MKKQQTPLTIENIKAAHAERRDEIREGLASYTGIAAWRQTNMVPKTIEEMVDHLVFRILDQFGVPHSQATRWKGESQNAEGSKK